MAQLQLQKETQAAENAYRNAALAKSGSSGGSGGSSRSGGNGVVANANATTISYGKDLVEALDSGTSLQEINSKIEQLASMDPRIDSDWLRSQANQYYDWLRTESNSL
jgi:hypothetical protein